MQKLTIPPKPAAPTPEIEDRWRDSAKRRRMLTGNWQLDLEEELSKHLPIDRRRAWGIADMSSNVFKSISQALAALYDLQPIVTVQGENAQNAAVLLGKNGFIDKAGLWPLMQFAQYMTIGLNDMFIRADIENGALHYRPVYPDMVSAFAPAGDPLQPYYLEELRLRVVDGKTEWTQDLYDLRNPKKPIYEVHVLNASGEKVRNITNDILGGNRSGTKYPYRDASGAPFLPFVAYHAQVNGQLFSAHENRELVAGSLSASMLYTAFLHITRDCSHPQRYISGLQLAGTTIYDSDNNARRAAIATDPASILCFVADPDTTTQPMIGQFQAGGDPLSLLEAITIYERRLAVYAGINPADIVKSSGDPRSGFAISLSQEAKREAQRRYAPIFRYSDIAMLSMSAKLCNRFLGTVLPEEGYNIKYQSLPLSPEELKAQREDIAAKLDLGLIGPIEAVMQLHPDFDRVEAVAYLTQIRKERIEFS